jgi:hypothetical protein
LAYFLFLLNNTTFGNENAITRTPGKFREFTGGRGGLFLNNVFVYKTITIWAVIFYP